MTYVFAFNKSRGFLGCFHMATGSTHAQRVLLLDKAFPTTWYSYALLHEGVIDTRRAPGMVRDGRTWYKVNIFTGEMFDPETIPYPAGYIPPVIVLPPSEQGSVSPYEGETTEIFDGILCSTENGFPRRIL